VPDVPIRRFLLRHGWLVAIAAAYLYIFPYYPKIHSANELPRIYLVKAIVEDHTFAIDHGVQQWGGTSDLSAHDHHYYANKAPGASLLVVPFYAAVTWSLGEPSLAETMWLCRIVTGVIPSLVFLWLLYGFLERYAPQPEIRRLVLIAYALGSLAMTYSLLYYSHQLSAVCLGSAWILALDAADRKRGRGAVAIAGFLLGSSVLVDYQAAFAVLPIAIHVLVRMRQARWTWAEIGAALGIAAIATAVPIAILLYYHAACFGSPLATGYNYAITYGSDHVHGLLGMTTPTWTAVVGTMVAPDNGFFTLAPWWLLAIPGGVVLWRARERGTVVAAAVIAFIFIYFITSLAFWRAGWEIGPRYITAMQPFLLPLVCAALASWRDRPLAIGAASGAIVAGVIIYSLTSATLPYWPDAIKNPLYEVTFRLLRDGAVAPSVGRVVGGGLLGIAPFLAGIAALVGWAIARASNLRGLALAAVIGAALIGAFALAPRDAVVADRAYANTLYPAVAQ
jgi:hypothetical protein